MPLHLFLIRHAQRLDHTDPYFHLTDSSQDPPITPCGRSTLTRLAFYLSHTYPCSRYTFYTSPFLRCVESVGILKKALKGDKVRLEPGLAEWMHPAVYGETGYMGVKATEMIGQRWREFNTILDENYVPCWQTFAGEGMLDEEGDENRESFRRRLQETLNYIMTRTRNVEDVSEKVEGITLVTHGACIQMLLEILDGGSVTTAGGLSDYPPECTSLSVCTKVENERWRVERRLSMVHLN